MTTQVAPHSQIKMVAIFLRALRNPIRLRIEPMLTYIAKTFTVVSESGLRTVLEIQLHQLPPRQRYIIIRHDLAGIPVREMIGELAISRRQFFRDRLRALTVLASLFSTESHTNPTNVTSVSDRRDFSSAVEGFPSLTDASILGLSQAGMFSAAISKLRNIIPMLPSRSQKLDALLWIGELSCDSGDRTTSKEILAELDVVGHSMIEPCQIARRLSIESDLVSDCNSAVILSRHASDILWNKVECGAPKTGIVKALVRSLIFLSYDLSRASRQIQAAQALDDATELITKFDLELSPIGVESRIAIALQSAQRFGNVGDALNALPKLLDVCLNNGWFVLPTKIAVAIMELSNRRFHYAEALKWSKWLSSMGDRQLTAVDRKRLVLATAHALNMVGRTKRATLILQGSTDEGYVFSPAVMAYRAEALGIAGRLQSAVREAAIALTQFERAHYASGIAQSNRLLAICYHGLGKERAARTHIAACSCAAQRSQSPYEILRAKEARAFVMNDARDRKEAAELTGLLKLAGGPHPCIPPGY